MNTKQFHRRLWGVAALLALLLTFLCSNLYTLQYTNGAEYAAQSVARVAETQEVAASRGLILDRNGQVLVSNQISYQVTLNISLMGEEEERCAILLALIRTAREEGVVWEDTLPISAQAPFVYTSDGESPFYTVGTDGEGNETRSLTRLGRLAVTMKWIEDPTREEEPAQADDQSDASAEPGLWDRVKAFFGLGDGDEADAAPAEPDRPPTAEELLGRMCESFGVAGENAVDKKAAQTVPTLNIGDMSAEDARAVAGVLYELYYRSRVNNWPPYVFAKDVDTGFITRVKELGLAGVEIGATSVRKYNTEYAAHLLGRVAAMDADEVDYYLGLEEGYTSNDKVGKDGAERAFEHYLRGTPGVQTVERNESGKIISSAWVPDPETGAERASDPGDNVFLTIDLGLQQKVEDTLAAAIPNLESSEAGGGACVVLDVNSGEVLASASYPTYSLSSYVQDLLENSTDPDLPMYNRALLGTYPPGSTFKMITAVAGLETGKIYPETKINDTGRYTYWPSPQPMCWIYRQYGGRHGLINVTEAIAVSCNYFFFDVGRRVGIDALDQYAAMFGLGQKTGIELAENTGAVASPAYSESRGQTWYEGNVLNVAIGQDNTQVTPIQLANYLATLVNGGTRYSTHLLKSVRSSDFSQVVEEYEPQVQDTVHIQAANLEAVKKGMRGVITDSATLSRYFQSVPVEVGAKTGSAQVSAASASNAVFVCFAPYDDPQVALAMVVEHGGSGSVLGSMAAEILSYYFTAPDSQEQIPQENTLVP